MSRHDKITEAIRKEISGIIHEELKDPRLGFVTIIRVELTRDYRYAKVFFSVLGTDEDYAKTKNALDSASGFIRRLIAQSLRLRFVPEISFREDRSCEYSIQIQKVLDEVKQLSQPQPPPPSVKEAGAKTRRRVSFEPKKRRRLHKKK